MGKKLTQKQLLALPGSKRIRYFNTQIDVPLEGVTVQFEFVPDGFPYSGCNHAWISLSGIPMSGRFAKADGAALRLSKQFPDIHFIGWRKTWLNGKYL